MKYIRTKDGIFPYHEDSNVGKLTVVINALGKVESNKVDETFNEIAIKQADTIKDLCDEYVVAYEDGARIVYSDLDWAKTKANASLEFGHKSVIYGAIWTDKGLIYVAKVNDKGELELL
ncbi:MAG: hypothetical protein J6S85_20835 [Methanobrevibacter sp.]|nr:hypothetical protein [Methanobrevibacter sp.]